MAIEQDIQRAKMRHGIIGDSPALLEAIGRALRVAPIDLSVLIVGESGSGKEFFPKIIHENSPRKHRKYIAVNCGAIPEGTIDSELFGHVKGAFTGATADHKGYFEEADGGTIFLDEVAEMPLSTQARLLRVLESGEYIKVGSSNVQKTNIRIVAATNKNMLDAIRNGKFREDLYYRLSTVHIEVPPLRERGHDIMLLTRKFLHDFSDNNHTPPTELTADAKQMLSGYRWPGNVRQLKSVVEQVALFEAGKTVDRTCLAKYLPEAGASNMPVPMGENNFDYNKDRELLFAMIFKLQLDIENMKKQLAGDGNNARININQNDLKREPRKLIPAYEVDHAAATPTIVHTDDYDNTEARHTTQDLGHVAEVGYAAVDDPAHIKTLEETERETIVTALDRNDGRRKATAEELGISERTLYRKIKQYGLERHN